MADDRANKIINTLRGKGIDPTKTSFNDLKKYLSVADIVYLNQHGVKTPGATTSGNGNSMPSWNSSLEEKNRFHQQNPSILNKATKLGADLSRSVQEHLGPTVGKFAKSLVQGPEIWLKDDPGTQFGGSTTGIGEKPKFLDGIFGGLAGINKGLSTLPDYGALSGGLGNGQQQAPGSGMNENWDQINQGGAGEQGGGGYGDMPTGSYTPATVSMPDMPDAPRFEFKRNDFSDDANRMTSEAYSPAFAALDEATKNSRSQYNTADAITKGLYDKLVGSINASGEASNAQYDKASADAAARGAATGKQIGNTYDQSAAQEAALMQRFGITGNDTISGDTSQKAYQQSETAQATQDQQDAFASSKQTQGDWNTGLANAQETQGTVARQDNLRDLNNILSNIDQQRGGLASEQAVKSIDLGQQLSSDDMSIQQMQYGAAQDQVQAIMQQAGMRFNVDSANASAQNQAGASNAQTELSNWQWKQQQQSQQNENSRNQSNLDRQYQADVVFKKAQMDQQAAEIEAKTRAGLNSDKPPKPGSVQVATQQLLPLVDNDPQKASQLMDLTEQVYTSSSSDQTYNDMGDDAKMALLIQRVQKAASEGGLSLSPDAIRQAAISYWSMLHGK